MLAAALVLGGKLMLVYLGLGLFRFLLPHRRPLRDLEDILYWIFWAIQVWNLLFQVEDGRIRWFFLAGIFLGMIGCREILGKPLKKLGEWVTIKKSIQHPSGGMRCREKHGAEKERGRGR